jgi:AcrR family transcriptional regulator
MTEAVSRPPGRPRSEASREAILDAAYWQTIERGYSAVTTDSIAKAAGAGKQTLYRWWPGKAAIVLDALAQKARARIDRPMEAAIRAGDLHGYLRAAIAALTTTGPALRCLMGEAQGDPDILSGLRRHFVEPRCDGLRRLLEQRVASPTEREILVEAIDGAIWRRLLLGEPLDGAFAAALAATVK